MKRSVSSLVVCVLLITIGATCSEAPPNGYCERLVEMRDMPFRSGEAVDDEVYNGLIQEGRAAVECLRDKVTDPTLMRDPRRAPPHPGFVVGDAAVMLLSEICHVPIESLLPDSARDQWKKQGIYAYFGFVGESPKNRQMIAEVLQAQRCD